MLAVLRSDRNGKHSTFSLVHGTLHPIHANPLEVIVLLSLYLAVLDDQSKEEQLIDVYNTYKRLVYHTAYKIMGDSYLAEDVLQEVFLYVAKIFLKFIEKTVTNSPLISLVVVEAVHTICFASSEKNRWKKSRTHQTMPRCRTMQ